MQFFYLDQKNFFEHLKSQKSLADFLKSLDLRLLVALRPVTTLIFLQYAQINSYANAMGRQPLHRPEPLYLPILLPQLLHDLLGVDRGSLSLVTW
tara:strand:- start:941 stop:1225 length:285 start_codon:yes stop_codon:yes gene_type:complete